MIMSVCVLGNKCINSIDQHNSIFFLSKSDIDKD